MPRRALLRELDRIGAAAAFEKLPLPGTDHLGLRLAGHTASREQPVPGIVLLHGGDGRAYRCWVEQWVARGYAAIVIDHAGGDEQAQPLPDGRPPMSHEEIFDLSIP